MNIDDLKAFKIVCELQSFTRAAAKMNFVQSNITAKIKRLEKHYQTQLLYRDKMAITPTPKGKELLNYINKILDLFEKADAQLIDQTHHELDIGSIETIAATYLPKVLECFRQTNKQAKLKITTGSTTQLISKVINRNIEGAFISGEIDHAELEAMPLYHEQLVIITKKHDGNPQLVNKAHAIIVFDKGCFYRSYFEKWLNYHKIIIDSMMTLNTLDGIIGCVKAGLGIAMLPKSVITNINNDNLDLYPVTSPFEHIPINFIYRKDNIQTPGLTQFQSIISNPSI